MAAQKGYDYEKFASNSLTKKLGITDGTNDGSRNQGPDVVLYKGKKNAGCELKIMPTAAGSLVLQYLASKGKWQFGPTDGDEDKEFLKSLGEENNVIGLIEKKFWKNKIPILQYDDNGRKVYTGKHTQNTGYKIDLKNFTNFYLPISASSITNYYITKGDRYLNVGTHGFYILEDTLKLNKSSTLKDPIPNFGDSVTAKIRVRCQYKSPGYQFALTMQFNNVSKSPYNLFPIFSKENVKVDDSKISKELISAFTN